MDIRDLIYFKTIVANGSLVAAATKLNISQPGLTYAIRRLEKELKVELFARGGNNVELNEAGKILLKYADSIIDEQDACLKELKYHTNRSRIFRLAACDPGPRWYLANVFSFGYPQLELDSYTYSSMASALRSLKSGKLDLLITDKPIEQAGLCCKFLARDFVYLSVHPEDARFDDTKEISLHDTRVDELVCFVLEGSFSEQLNKLYAAIGDKTQIVYENELFAFLSRIRAKKSLTLNTRLVTHYRNDGDGRKLIPVTDAGSSINYYLVYKEDDEFRLSYILDIADDCALQFP